ncbi:MAG: O-antigen ligase family protein [Lachnospiraceae bacterium]|nr:O-antigen ligase family protein [Lachnospiraceae bacterium]
MNEKNNGNTRNEKFLALLLMAKLIEFTVESVVTAIGSFSTLMIIVMLLEELIYLVCGIAFIFNYFSKSNEERIVKHTLIRTIFLMIGLTLLYIILSDNEFIVRNFGHAFRIILICGSIFYFAASITVDYSKVVKYLGCGIPLAIVYGFISAFVLHTDYMVIANITILYAMISYHLYKLSNSKKFLIGFIVLSALILFAGSRGALLWLIVFYVIYNLLLNRGITKKGLITVSALIMLIIVSILFESQIIGLLASVFPNSRTIEMISISNIADDSSRTNIWKFFAGEIAKEPLRIHGLFSDRLAINQNFMNSNRLGYWITENRSYSYAHNIFLELLYDFGVFIGGIICIKIILLIGRIAKFSRDTDNKAEAGFYLIMLTSGFFMLLISDSFLLNVYFWFFIGLSNRTPKIRKFKIGNIRF